MAVSLAALLTLLLTARRWAAAVRPGRWLLPSGPMAIVLGALALSVAFSFIPTPSFPQYFAPPLVCLPLGLALLFARLEPDARPNAQPALIAATIVVLVMAAPRLVQHLGTVMQPERWTVMRVHADGVAMANDWPRPASAAKWPPCCRSIRSKAAWQYIPSSRPDRLRIELPTSRRLTIAVFYRMTSPTRIAALLDADPPAALLLGFDPALEAPMLAYAKRNGYVPVPDFCDRRPIRHRHLVHQAQRQIDRPAVDGIGDHFVPLRENDRLGVARRRQAVRMLPVSAAMAGRLRRPKCLGKPVHIRGGNKQAGVLTAQYLGRPPGTIESDDGHSGRQRLQQDIRKTFESRAQYENVSGGKPVARGFRDPWHPNTVVRCQSLRTCSSSDARSDPSPNMTSVLVGTWWATRENASSKRSNPFCLSRRPTATNLSSAAGDRTNIVGQPSQDSV